MSAELEVMERLNRINSRLDQTLGARFVQRAALQWFVANKAELPQPVIDSFVDHLEKKVAEVECHGIAV